MVSFRFVIFAKMKTGFGTTMIYITHIKKRKSFRHDRPYHDHGRGNIVQIDTYEIIITIPADEFVLN